MKVYIRKVQDKYRVYPTNLIAAKVASLYFYFDLLHEYSGTAWETNSWIVGFKVHLGKKNHQYDFY